RHEVVTGPLTRRGGTQHDRVGARWLFVHETTAGPATAMRAGDGPVAVVEACEAAGRQLLPAPSGDEPVRATTAGVGELLARALDAGARQVLVCVGGTATTDGGWGAIAALAGDGPAHRVLERARNRLSDVHLVVAADVVTTFLTAARVYAPQKGASSEQVVLLEDRLAELSERFRDELGFDVEGIRGTGAGGGLAGGLTAIGAVIVEGFPLFAQVSELERRLEGADLVMTGEGRLDETSFAGKVVGGVLSALGGTLPALCIAGEVTPDAERALATRPAPVEVVSLVDLVGRQRAVEGTESAIEAAVFASLASGGA
ncbi:MAG: glycerate kinase, partial [Acidimicrobiales bacterium]